MPVQKVIRHTTVLTTQTPGRNKIYSHISSIFTEGEAKRSNDKVVNETEKGTNQDQYIPRREERK